MADLLRKANHDPADNNPRHGSKNGFSNGIQAKFHALFLPGIWLILA